MKTISKAVLLSALCFPNVVIAHNYIPKDGYVPDAQSAKAIAEIVLKKIYGTQQIDEEKPFLVKLERETWVISGNEKMDGYDGGVFEILISKKTGEIISVTHEK